MAKKIKSIEEKYTALSDVEQCFKTSQETQKILNISSATLMNWRQTGKIAFKQISEKKYLYDVNSVLNPSTISKLDKIIMQNEEIINLLKNV